MAQYTTPEFYTEKFFAVKRYIGQLKNPGVLHRIIFRGVKVLLLAKYTIPEFYTEPFFVQVQNPKILKRTIFWYEKILLAKYTIPKFQTESFLGGKDFL